MVYIRTCIYIYLFTLYNSDGKADCINVILVSELG